MKLLQFVSQLIYILGIAIYVESYFQIWSNLNATRSIVMIAKNVEKFLKVFQN